MPDYDIYDSSGSYCGSISISGSDTTASEGGIVFIIILYILSLIGGITMISTVAETSPMCIVPAALAFIIMLVPIIYLVYNKVVKRPVSITGFLRRAINLSNYLLIILLLVWWTMYLSQTASIVVLNILAFSFMYFMVLSVYSVCQKINIATAILGCLVPGVVLYIIIYAISSSFKAWHLMTIPTYAILSSITVLSIKSLKNGVIPKFTLIFIVLAIAFEGIFGFTTVVNFQKKFEEAKVLIEQGDYRKAREILKHNTIPEAKTLYNEIRYKDLAIGDVIYNGYYTDSDKKTIDDKGLAFTCLSIENNVAYFISNDIMLLTDEPSFYYDISSLDYKFMEIDKTNIISLDGKENHCFTIPTLDDFNNYKNDEVLKQFILNYNISKSAKKQEKEILADTSSYAWGGKGNKTYINSWFIYDTNQNKFYQINENNEVDSELIYRSSYYGVRICYKVSLQ